MKIAGYLPTSLLEWPGQISAVVFTPGCNLRCPFCHNPDLVDWSGGASKLIGSEVILADLKLRQGWIDGLAISGGEPTLQPDLIEFLGLVKKMGLGTMVETNGTRPETVRLLIEKKKVDYWAMDYKFPWVDYDRFRSKSEPEGVGKRVSISLKQILASRAGFELRTTVVPTLHDELKLVKMGRALRRVMGKNWPARGRWQLQSFRPKKCLVSRFEKIKPMLVPEEKKLLAAVKKVFPWVTWRGHSESEDLF